MLFQQIRSATSIVSFGGKRFLIDPMLAPANTYPIVPDAPVCGRGNPTIELPCRPEDLFDVDAYIVTHWHFDHFDEVAMRILPKDIPLFAKNEKEAQASREIGFTDVRVLKEEGIEFRFLTNPTRILGDENGRVVGMECIEMELGAPDESGRRRPIKKEGSEFVLDLDTVIIAIGTTPNPLIRSTTKGLETNRKGCFVVDDSMATTREGVYAGGDAVTGAATIILAMGAGKKAAAAIHKKLSESKTNG